MLTSKTQIQFEVKFEFEIAVFEVKFFDVKIAVVEIKHFSQKKFMEELCWRLKMSRIIWMAPFLISVMLNFYKTEN